MAKKHNPFSIFRRNQRAWMAGLTLFTMFSFIALGSMLQCVGTRNQGTGPRFMGEVAKTQKFGKLDYNEFLSLRADAIRLQTFVSGLAEAAQALQAQPSESVLALRIELSLATSESQVLVDRWLIGQFAKKEKLAASDAAALQYLQLLTQVTQYNEKGEGTVGSLPTEALQNCMRIAGLTESQLRDLLKEQIAYERYIRKYDGGRRNSSLYSQFGIAQMGYGHGALPSAPGEALEAYEALHRQAKAKVATYKASDYFDEVGEPSEEQARALYEQYKDVEFSADSKTPGFTQPLKIAFEVVRADVDDDALNAVSDEEVKAYYEAHKEEYRRPKPAEPKEEAKDETPVSMDAIPEDAVDAFGTKEAAPAEAPAAEEATPAEVPAAEEAAPAEAPATEEAAPAEAPAAEEAAPSASLYRKADVVLAYQQEAEAVAEDDEEILEESANDAPAADAEVFDADSEYFPFSMLEPMIRRRLACEKIEAKMRELNANLQAYYRSTINEKAEKVADVDMRAFAEANGMQYHLTSRPESVDTVAPIMISLEEARIAELLPTATLDRVYQSVPLPLAPQREGTYDPEAHPEQQWNPPTAFYVYRSIESKAQYKPEFDEAKAAVVEAWKTREAIKFAQNKADEIVKQAKEEGADFDQIVAASNGKVVETEKFSWFKPALGSYGDYAQLSEVREAGVEVGKAQADNKEIVAPGWKFYETLFNLPENGVGSCLNQSEDRVFVIKVVERDADSTITDNFEAIETDRAAAYVMMQKNAAKIERFHDDFIKELRDKAGFEWLWIPRVEEQR